jgi:glycosyltransferase involved in cell wall biosynthesis
VESVLSKFLFVVAGMGMGGVETYIVRLAKELSAGGHDVDVLILSKKNDPGLMSELLKYSTVFICERVPFLRASSWINAFLPIGSKCQKAYDIVHVVDLLTLGFVYFNRNVLKFKSLSIGIYHSMEICWWRDRSAYFRRKLIELYDRNVKLTLFPNESTAQIAAEITGVSLECLSVVPLGIELAKYSGISPSKHSLKIVSVGRLVDFKVYNKHVIAQLSALRAIADFEYYIYGDGPERAALESLAAKCGVERYVHFMGEVKYDDLPGVLSGAFCFVGSGTSIIEASAAGIPSVVGIESIKEALTCGLFSSVSGFSYNEIFATSHRVSFFDVISSLYFMSDSEYSDVVSAHRYKSSFFNIQSVAAEFMERSNKYPDFDFTMNRWRALMSFFLSNVRYGMGALKSRFDS